MSVESYVGNMKRRNIRLLPVRAEAQRIESLNMNALSVLAISGAFVLLYRIWRSYAEFRKGFMPVLMYHALTDNPAERDDMVVHRSDFERQMRWLVDRGYQTVTSSAVLEEGDRANRRLIAITFDDGFSSVHRHALPVMRRLGLNGTVFVSTDFVGRAVKFPWPFAENDPPLSWSQIEELRQAGIEIGSHGCSHVSLTELDEAESERELYESRRVIRQATGVDPLTLAYPSGDFNERVKRAVGDAGFRAAFAVFSDPRSADRLSLPRITIRNQTTMTGFWLRTLGIHPYIKSRYWFSAFRPLLRRWRYAFL